MKRSVLFALLILVSGAGVVGAEEVYVDVGPGCFNHALVLTGSDQEVLLVNTAKILTVDKQQRVFAPADVAKGCNSLGKRLHGALLKVDDVSSVVITPRQIAVSIYVFPNGWDAVRPVVVKQIKRILCGKAAKK